MEELDELSVVSEEFVQEFPTSESRKAPTSAMPRAVVQQLSETPPISSDGTVDWAGVILLIATLLGGGGAGLKAMRRSTSSLRQEQASASRRILADNEDQHRKLNNILDRLSEVLDKLESLEKKVPAPKKRKTKKETT